VEKIPDHHTRPKNTKKAKFKDNFRLVKIVIVQKSYLLTIFGLLCVKKYQKLGLY
jgi:hypothetical protein